MGGAAGGGDNDEETDHESGVTGHCEVVVAAVATHVEAAGQRAGHAGEDLWDHEQTCAGGRVPPEALVVEGDVEHGGEPAGEGEEVAGVAGDEGTVEYDPTGGKGFGSDAGFNEDEEGKKDHSSSEGEEGEEVTPGEVGAAIEAEEEGEIGDDEEERAQDIDTLEFGFDIGLRCWGEFERDGDGKEGEKTEGSLNEEGVAPADGIG